MINRNKVQAGINLTREIYAELRYIADSEFKGNLSAASEHLIKLGLEQHEKI